MDRLRAISRQKTESVSIKFKRYLYDLQNTNIMYALAPELVNAGNLRETFFYNQLNSNHNLTTPKQGDFLVDKKYTFEIGGKNKTMEQIASIQNGYIAADDIEYGFKNKIPLWLFGFLY